MTYEPDRTTSARTSGDGRDPAAPVRNPTEARQGTPLGRMRLVLAIGIVGVAVAFLIAYWATRP
ncbi:hypothetical protein [Oharaeibacter diazotrophicus]|uniref:Uncharacterized protein n=1 Tax=Oharaeibacter diazotrophicus TaxID=1920512 RepID=A0A4R6R8N6_9HYPH|nr:hypothetical protein [Oharaeibacter diazotrophicus]TDP82401.1 hypothetical protein EDD54_3668 [Oharaeibacter diazotrophicus]BBE72836.1 hypothetical protein OHA_1_02435 [Pleomorphomonas sp. SM30]GLS76875.1 hypothetical protein GCM10007904_22120 [Oharaeibacter diazotrophicus]